MSHPFPALFSKKKRPEPTTYETDSDSDDAPVMTKPLGNTQKNTHKRGGANGSRDGGSRDFATGNCMTCGSLVRWPRDLRVFKCTVCLTINDLPPDQQARANAGPKWLQRPSQDSTSPQKQPPRPADRYEARPISLDQTKRLIRQCIRNHLTRAIRRTSSFEDERREVLEKHLAPSHADNGDRPCTSRQMGSGVHRRQNSHDNRPAYLFPEQPTLHPNPQRVPPPSRSFSSSYPERPPSMRQLAAEASGPRPADPRCWQADDPKRIFKPLEDYIMTCFNSFHCVNSSFLSRRPAPAVRSGTESWMAVYEEMNREAGAGAEPGTPVPDPLSATELRALESQLLHGQEHTHRALLKATENLLIRQNEKKQEVRVDITAGLIPNMSAGHHSAASLHAALGTQNAPSKKQKEQPKKMVYSEDWQIKAAARVLALIFAANNMTHIRRPDQTASTSSSTTHRGGIQAHGQIIPTSDFYNTMIDYTDLVAEFEAWELKRGRFSFCQYPFLLSMWAKSQILEHDARRQQMTKARDAFFDSIMTRRAVTQFLVLDVRRECLVDDSLKAVSEVIGSGSEDIKKGLRIVFKGEEGLDAGGLKKEWFLLLVREVFNPDHGMFIYDEDSQFCYFNPNSFETSDQYFLVGVVMGLAIYNSTILDVALPPFAFRKLLASAPSSSTGPSAHPRPSMNYTLEDLAEYRPRLAAGLRQLLEFDGDVEETFQLDFVVDVEKYGIITQVPLCPGGERKVVTNANKWEYVNLYVRYLLETAVTRQFEPFKRGFYTVCGGNALSLFRPEEIELLVRGSDTALDVDALRGVAEYDNWGTKTPDGVEPVVGWFWETFKEATPEEQRKLLSFITGTDRVPAMGAALLPIKITCLGEDENRYPIARTCFNMLSLRRYGSRERLEQMLWTAVHESEGFGLK
ncbi:putative E3 ubiquitin-protein ligase [Colletotrichum sp. SAR 10_77]|nr:putative E3 ubiquitin-protein ligase [Colletotrichum sp. SAR 10_77]